MPSFAVYEAWASAMRVRALPIGPFCQKHGQSYQQIRMKTTGATSDGGADELRAAMIAEVGQELFHTVYAEHLRAKGYAA